jgi:hypothetical protein
MGNPNYTISPASTDPKVKGAQIELAWFINKYSEDFDRHSVLQANGVKSFSLSRFSESLDGMIDFPQTVKNFLADFDTGSGGYVVETKRDYN